MASNADVILVRGIVKRNPGLSKSAYLTRIALAHRDLRGSRAMTMKIGQRLANLLEHVLKEQRNGNTPR